MKINLRTWIKALQIACLASALFLTSCKEKKYTFENPCVAPAPPIASNNSPVASGASVQFTTETVAGGSYQWSGPNGFSSTEQNPSFILTNNNQVGDYTVSVTVGGCTSVPYHSYVSSCSVAPVLTSYSPVLLLDTTYLITTPFIPEATYNWTLPNGTITNSQNIFKVKVQVADTGVYTLVVTLKNGCSTPAASKRVKIRPNTPVIKATGSGVSGTKIAVTGTLSLDLTPTSISGYNGNGTFEWFGPNGFTSNVQNPVITGLTKANEGEYKVVAKLNGFFSDTARIKVVVRYFYKPCSGTTVTVGAQVVKIVQIGTQCWTSENLKKITAPPDQYLWADMMVKTPIDSQGVCPVGWHPPSDAEFTILTNFVNNDGNALKLVGQGSGAGAGTNTSGFSAKLGITGGNAFFWTSTSYGANYAWYRQLFSTNNAIQRGSADNTPPAPGVTTDPRKKYYVRCIQD